MNQNAEPTEHDQDEIEIPEGFSLLSRSIFKIVAVILLLLICCAGWVLLVPHSKSTDGPGSLSETRAGCPIPLPDSARNIQYTSYRHFLQFDEIVRFEAPAQDCIAHIDTVITYWREGLINPPESQPAGPSQLAGAPEPITTSLEADWFDLENVKNYIHAGGGPGLPECWVDLDRGIFYFRMHD